MIKSLSQLINEDALSLIHELQVREIELYLQNEELLLANEENKLLASKYTDLFNFAPMGYFTLSEKAEILDLNLSGAKMLGKLRSNLINSHFGFFVSEDTNPIFNRFIYNIFSSKTDQICHVILTPENQVSVHVRLAGNSTANHQQCLLTVTDIEIEKQAEEILRISEESLQAEVKKRTLEFKNSSIAFKTELLKRKTSQKNLKKSLNDLKIYSSYVLNSREEERNNIARIIHDDLAQMLMSLKMELTLFKGKTSNTEPIEIESVDSMLQLLDGCFNSVNLVIKELRPVALKKLGLLPALKQLFSDFQNNTGIVCDVRIIEVPIPIKNNEMAFAIYRIVQEGLNNIRRHSNARYVTVKISGYPNSFSLTLKDNGRGITRKEISDPGSFGITGMKERTAILGGKITFRGIPDKGTTLKLSVPLKSKLINTA